MTSASEQYREIVRHYAPNGLISPDVRQILERQQRYLKLLSQEAEAIERSVLQLDSQADSQTDLQTDLQANSNSDSQADFQTSFQKDLQTSSPLDSQTNLPLDSLLDSLLDSQSAQQPDPSPVLLAEHNLDQATHQNSPVAPTPENLAAPADASPSETHTAPEPEPAAVMPEEPSNPEAISRYQAAFAQAIRFQFPLNEVLKLGLRSLQQTLNLTDQHVEAIEIRSLEALDAEQQQYKANLEKYREEFEGSRAFLYSESVQDELWELQRKLKLRSEDVLRLEREVMQDARRDSHHEAFPPIEDSFASAGIQALEDKIKDELFNPTNSEPSHGTSRPLVSTTHLKPETRVTEEADVPFADSSLNQSQPGSKASANANAKPNTQEKNSGSQEGSTVGSTIIVRSELEQAFQELEKHLGKEGQRDWWEADQITFEILLKLSPNPSLNWLNMQAIETITQNDALERIDRLWSVASEGRYGLFAQQEVYKKVIKDLQDEHQSKLKGDRLQQLYIQEFVRRIGWWDNRLQFLKFYKWLDFHADLASRPDIPAGQFPAYWFWVIPRPYAFQLGGIGFGQGGWRVDVSRLRAWMTRLRNCKLEPYEKYVASPSRKPTANSSFEDLPDL